MSYLTKELNREVHQNEKQDVRQVRNDAGGYAFQADDWTRLRRWLILGSEGGDYYAGQRQRTFENVEVLERLAEKNPYPVYEIVRDTLINNRAVQRDMALYALARLTKTAASVHVYAQLHKTIGNGGDLLMFVSFVDSMRGWGSGLRKAVANWYLKKDPQKLAFQTLKYQHRSGWSQRDVLRLAHPRATKGVVSLDDDERNQVLRYAVKGKISHDGLPFIDAGDYPFDGLQLIQAVEAAKTADKDEVIMLIDTYRLTREMVPSEFLNDPDVMMALVRHMPYQAMLRNLNNFEKMGLLSPMSDSEEYIAQKIKQGVHKARIHPFHIMLAREVYSPSVPQLIREQFPHHWVANQDTGGSQRVVAALDGAFETALAGKAHLPGKVLAGIDVSGSMASPVDKSGKVSSAVAAASVAHVLATVADRAHLMMFAHEFKPFRYDGTLRSAIDSSIVQNFGGTDVALPMEYALKKGIEVDTFVVLTDNQTWQGRSHPHKSLERYRREVNPQARLAVLAFASNAYTVTDPDDSGSMDLVGLDGSVMPVLEQFIQGEL